MAGSCARISRCKIRILAQISPLFVRKKSLAKAILPFPMAFYPQKTARVLPV